MKTTLRMKAQHYLNGIRVRIFFQKFMCKSKAITIAKIYERLMKPVLYPRTGK